MSLANDLAARFAGFGVPAVVHSETEVRVQGQVLVKIRLEDEWITSYRDYKRARSINFDVGQRTLIHNNSVEMQLTRLNSTPGLVSDSYALADRRGNTVEVKSASRIFSFAFFHSPEYERYFGARVKERILESSISIRRMHTLMWSPFTALYTCKGRKTPPDLLERATAAVKSSLFKIAVEQHDCLNIWKPVARRLKFAQPAGAHDSNNTIPSAKYDDPVVGYYKVAKASPFPSQSFLAYYNVLEYYFLRVTELVLHDRLQAVLNAPTFRADGESLDRVISLVRGRDARNDETEMLRAVLDRFVPEEDLIEFLIKIEDACGEKIYTKKRPVFGDQVHIAPLKDHALANAAKTLKHVRNAIVHSSDKYKRDERHIPLSDSENTVEEFIPLVRFFAEKVIYGTAS